MNVNHILRARGLGFLAGSAALALGVVTAGPAAAAPPPSAFVSSDTLTVRGSSLSERIALRLAAGDPDTIQVDFGDNGSADFSFDRDTFNRILVFARGGDDRVRIDEANGEFADEATTINGGQGDDILAGGRGDERFFGAPGDDFVDGNGGADSAFLGTGGDSFQWDPGDGSDVVEGQKDIDTLVFNGNDVNEAMQVLPDGPRALFLRNIGAIRMDLADVERVDVAALGGADSLVVEDMAGTDVNRVDLDLAGGTGAGDGQPDVVTVNGSAEADEIDVEAENGRVDVQGDQTLVGITGHETADRLEINGLDGDDEIDVDQEVLTVIDLAVDLGLGQR